MPNPEFFGTSEIKKFKTNGHLKIGKFVLRETATGFKFDLKATNGEIIAVSEGYKTKENCENGIASVKKNAPDA